MKITKIQIRLTEHKRLKGVASIEIDGSYLLNDIKIIQTVRRLCLEFPKSARGDDLFAPMNAEAREAVEKSVLDKYALMRSLSKGKGG